jgi:hypothetical protein
VRGRRTRLRRSAAAAAGERWCCSVKSPALPPAAVVVFAPCGNRICSLRLPSLLTAVAGFARYGGRICSLRWPDLLATAVGFALYGGCCCSLRRPSLLPTVAGVVVDVDPSVLQGAGGAATTGGRWYYRELAARRGLIADVATSGGGWCSKELEPLLLTAGDDAMESGRRSFHLWRCCYYLLEPKLWKRSQCC